MIPRRAKLVEPYPHCIYCKGKTLVFCRPFPPHEWYVGCDAPGCYARGPVSKTRKGAIGKYNELVKRVFWSKRRSKEPWEW